MTSITKAIVPAAGLGTRLRPLTDAIPKEMLPVGRKPALQLIYEELTACGIPDILIVTSAAKTTLEEYCTRVLPQPGGPRVHLVRQASPLGSADAIAYGEEFAAGECVAVALGDTVVHTRSGPPRMGELLDVFQREQAHVAILVDEVPRDRVCRYGIVAPRRAVGPGPFPITDIVEKPRTHEAPSCWAVGGRYALRPAIFDAIRCTQPGVSGELQITDSIRIMLGEGAGGWAVPAEPQGSRYDIGSPEDYLRAFLEVSADDPEFGEQARAVMARLTGQEARAG